MYYLIAKKFNQSGSIALKATREKEFEREANLM